MPTTLIHQHDSWSCFGCCAAMAAGQTLEDFIKFTGHDGSDWSSTTSHPEHRESFSLWEVISYLASHEIMLGTFAIPLEGEKTLDVLGVDSIDINWPINRPAIVCVKSERLYPNADHVIFWDGKKVYDPYPDTKRTKLKDYELLEWYPLLYKWN